MKIVTLQYQNKMYVAKWSESVFGSKMNLKIYPDYDTENIIYKDKISFYRYLINYKEESFYREILDDVFHSEVELKDENIFLNLDEIKK